MIGGGGGRVYGCIAQEMIFCINLIVRGFYYIGVWIFLFKGFILNGGNDFFVKGIYRVMIQGYSVGIYCQLIPDWIESARVQIFYRQFQNGDTEPNSKYSLKNYFQIV